MSGWRFLVTCEHGGNRIPPRFQHCFAGDEALLGSHRGYDPGALALARDLARELDAPLICSTTSRLLVDLNRSLGHPKLHSDAIRNLPAEVRSEIVAQYYLPYRNRAEQAIAKALEEDARIVHLSSHSFTPVLDGVVRNADAALLYDPARAGELALCRGWSACLKAKMPGLRVRKNYPYTGKSDGLTAHLRKRFAADCYLGIEIEINQRIVQEGGKPWRKLRESLLAALVLALGRFDSC